MNRRLNIKAIGDFPKDAKSAWELTEDEDESADDKIDYNITLGNEKIVFIKAGAGGSARGHGDKYAKMAERIHERTDATVITASNPMDLVCDDSDVREILGVVERMGFEHFELYLVGLSDGAYLNLDLAKQFTQTRKWIGINPSFIEMSDFEARLKALPSVSKLLIYGTEDGRAEAILKELGIDCKVTLK